MDGIRAMQQRGYAVVLIFVGLTALPLSIMRVQGRMRTGGHKVPLAKLVERFPRTQQAIGVAATVADLIVMVDNSLSESRAFEFVRAQRKRRVLFDARDPRFRMSEDVLVAASPWLEKVVGPYRPARRPQRTSSRA